MATNNEGESLRCGLVGRWIKVTDAPQTERYPDRLEFSNRGTFVGANDSASRYHPCWDVGQFQVAPGGKIRIATANDAQIDYLASLSGDELVFTVGEKDTVRYRREK